MRIGGNVEGSVDSRVDSVGAVDLAMTWRRQPRPPPPPTLLFYSSNTNGQSETSHSVHKIGEKREILLRQAVEEDYLQPTVTQN